MGAGTWAPHLDVATHLVPSVTAVEAEAWVQYQVSLEVTAGTWVQYQVFLGAAAGFWVQYPVFFEEVVDNWDPYQELLEVVVGTWVQYLVGLTWVETWVLYQAWLLTQGI